MKLTRRRELLAVLAALLLPWAGNASVPADIDIMSLFPTGSQTSQAPLNLVKAPAAPIELLPPGILTEQPRQTIDLDQQAIPGFPLPAPRSQYSAADLAGPSVMTARSLRSDSFGDDGNSCTITQIEGTDSIKITGFWNNAITLKAKVNAAEGTITIPNQVVGQMVDNGNIDIAYCLSNGKPDRKKAITGIINSDGSITINDWWGIYVVAGTNKDRYAFAGADTRIMKANATMSFNFLSGEKVDFNVYVTQPYNNRILITNFGNYGMTVYVDLNTSRGGTIPAQVARQYPANKANFITCAIGSYDAAGNPAGITGNINLIPAAEGNNNTLSWGKWTAISQGTQNMYFGAIVDGKITLNQGTFTYPKPVTGFLEGQGTAQSPYLIRTMDDMIRLAQGVNNVPESEFNGFLNGMKCARVYQGKHFRLENDIDMGSALFTPIGADALHYFAGTFDGQNHTIKNLAISSNTGLAALFGLVDPMGTVKNLKLDKPTVTCNFQTAGTVCGWSFGVIENCHVTNADVTNYARIVGGVVGVGHVVKNCTVSDSHILGANGNPGGIAGAIDSLITDCHVINTNVVGATGNAGLPAGGVVGGITNGKGSNLSFSGTVDTRTYMCTMSTGGVVGVLSNSTLDQSFATGEVKAGPTDNYSRSSAAGGVAGKCYGSVVENCYFTGSVSTYTNRRAGGITGWLTNEVAGTDTIAPVVRNCYTASLVTSETYLYDKEKEARETIGWVDEGCDATLTNLYYDTQLTNLNSTRFGSTTAKMTSASGLPGFDANIWSYTAGQYPRLKVNANRPEALHSASAIILPERSTLKKISGNADLHPLGTTSYKLYNNGSLSDQGHFCKINGNKLEISEDFGTDTLRVINGNTGYDLEIRIAPVPFEGDGTEQNPFLIRTKSDLQTLAHVTTEVLQTFPGDHFLMTNDIDMEGDSTFIGICAQPGTAGTFNKFAGVFDGGNHRIKNLHMRMIVWTTRPEADKDGLGTPNSKECNGVTGFFGRLAPEGIIRNLVIDSSSDFQFWSRSGAIVGQNEGLVENCRNHADVRAASGYPGGIVGENRKGTVRRCYNDGTITTGANGVGGIVGTGNGRIEECVNVGTVRAMMWTRFQTNEKQMYRCGGIQGENSGTDFYNCVNYGHVEGYKEVGGIAGQLANVTSTSVLGHNELHNVINLGDLTSTEEATIGCLGGTAGTTGTVEGAYWDSQISIYKAHGSQMLKGSEGITTAMLTSGTPLKGFDAGIWDFAKDKYPVPAWCADEPMLQHARSLIVNINEGYRSSNFHGTARLMGLSGHTWTLSENSPYTINGGQLSAPTTVTERVEGILYGTSGKYKRTIALTTNLPVPLAGNGTESDPYQIKTVDDWTKLANYIPTAKDNFSGKYIKVMNDIDFEGAPFKPLFIGTSALEGTLDGGNFTLKNIKYAAVNSYEAVIGVVEITGVLKNFRAQGEITTAVANTGGTTAKVYGTIVNCENQMNVTATKGAGHSGFGYVYGGARFEKVSNRATITGANGQLAGLSHNVSAEGVVFTDCVNYGTIKSTSTSTSCNNFGGLVAICYPVTFINCRNEGKFEFTKPDGTQWVGGIIGSANSSSTPKQYLTLINCENKTDIMGKANLAGIVANMASQNCKQYIENCVNRGNISAISTTSVSSAPTAGITGFFTPNTIIRGCVNYGKISSQKNVWAAGIAPYYKGTATEATQIRIVDCHNYGDIEALGNQGAGIVGCGNAWLHIDSCSNTGTVTGGFGLAGIVSNFSGNGMKVTHCWNEGNISTTVYRAGGIAGWGNTEGEISDCFNTGDISTSSTIKGTSNTSGSAIGGIAGYSGCHIIRCYNLGTVAGASQVGGIVGLTFKNRTQLKDCYNAGEIVADADTCGSLVGINTTANGSNWNTGNKIENCFYVPQEMNLTNDVLGTLKSYRDLCTLSMGEGWINCDNYSLPYLSSLDNEVARLWSAWIVPDGNDNFKNITYNFSVGLPQGVVWSANIPQLSFIGNRARFTAPYKGALELTATLGERSRKFNLNVTNATGVDGIDGDGAAVVSEMWFTTEGVRIAKPSTGKRGIYVVKRKYSNGTVRSEKVIVK